MFHESLKNLDPKFPLVVDPVVSNGRGFFAVKRLMDILFSGVSLILLSPLLVVVSLAIRLTSRGPVIYSQTRMGARRIATKEGYAWAMSPFTLYKFRSMLHGSPVSLHEEFVAAYVRGKTGDLDNPTHKIPNDPRLTRIGSILRKYSIDELPQLWNVLNGTMSLVGPRPVPIYEVKHYDQYAMRRLAGTPGLTGYWQVSGRGALSFKQMVQLDLQYVSQQSLMLDLKLLFKTVKVVALRIGAQ